MLVWIVCAFLSQASEPAKPAEAAFEAEVIGSNVFAHSGPGSDYYPTLLLRAGQIVTVTGRTSDDWVAILPPKESFSWVPRESIQENSDGTGTVLLDGTQIRVGSSLSDARYVHQAVLSKGDRVQVIDEVTLAGRQGAERWYKIVPPSSERRYVPTTAIRVIGSGETLGRSSSPYQNVSQSSLEPIAARVGARVIPPAEPLMKSDERAKILDPLAAGAPGESKVSIVDDASKSVTERASSIEAQLAKMRTRRPEEWELDSAKRILQEIGKSATTDAEREAVAEAEQLEQQMRGLLERYLAISKRRELFLRQDEELSKMLRQAKERWMGPSASYDAEGVLRRASVSIDQQLTYLLEDATGSASHYVTFPSGLNGESYLGQKVGLIGTVTRRDHVPIPRIEVEQVTPIGGR